MSAKKQLTDIGIQKLRPGNRTRDVPDGRNGLYLIVQPSGHKSFAVRYNFKGKQVKLTLKPPYPGTTLATARKAAIEAREAVEAGIDPNAAKRAEKAAEAVAQRDTVAEVCKRCLEFKGAELRSADQQRAILNRLVYPSELGAMPIKDVRRDDIFALLDKIKKNSGGRMADVVLMLLRRSFNWYQRRKSDFNSPIMSGMGLDYYRPKEHRGTRILSDDEIRKLWASTADGTTFSAFIRFLVATGCRRNEAAGLRWSEIDGDIWTLPAARSKSKEAVTRPLSALALRIIEERPHIDGCDFVFTTTGIGRLTNFGKPTARLREQSGTNGWRLHDLRRTARSLLSRADVNVDVAERCLGHGKQGVRSIYDHHDFVPRMKVAFEALAAQVERITNPPKGDVVVPMKKRR